MSEAQSVARAPPESFFASTSKVTAMHATHCLQSHGYRSIKYNISKYRQTKELSNKRNLSYDSMSRLEQLKIQKIVFKDYDVMANPAIFCMMDESHH